MNPKKGVVALKKQTLIVLTVALLAGGLFPKAARAQASSKIAIINIQQAIAECEEGKKESSILNAKANAKKSELEKLQKDIEAMQKQLQDQATTLNDDARAQLAQQIQKKNNDLKRQQEDAQEEIQTFSNEIITKIGRKMMGVLEQYAAGQGLTAILDSSSPQGGLLWFSPTANITTEIIRRYDAANSQPATAPKPATPPPTKK